MKFLSALLIITALSFSSSFAQGLYMELAVGTGTATPYAGGEILLTSISYGFSNSVTIGGQTGGTGAAKAVFAPILITKQIDPSTAPIQQALFTGRNYQRVRLNFYRPLTGGGRELAYQVVLGTVLVSNYQAGAAEGCTSGCPAVNETITLEYGQVVTREFVNGQPTRVTTWNRINNTENVDQFLLATN
ncbi:hypothetical protein GCM10027592_05710 [Spirosoma flavus]